MAVPEVKVYYGKPMLPDVSRVLACLYEKNIKFKLIDIHKGQKTMPVDFLKLQAKASSRVSVPTFEDGDTMLFESQAISRYVLEKYAEQGNRNLLGRDLLERASIEQWLKLEKHSFDPPSWTLAFYSAFAPLIDLDIDPALIEQSERKLSKVLDVYDQRLGENKFLAGNKFTLADLSHLPNSHYLVNSKEWSNLFTSRKNISNWWTRISSRPSWRKVEAEMLNQVPVIRETVITDDGVTPQNTLHESSQSLLPSRETLLLPPPPPTQMVPTQPTSVSDAPQSPTTKATTPSLDSTNKTATPQPSISEASQLSFRPPPQFKGVPSVPASPGSSSESKTKSPSEAIGTNRFSQN